MTDSKSQLAPPVGTSPAAPPPTAAVAAPAAQAPAAIVIDPPKSAADAPPEWLKTFNPESQEAINKAGWKAPDEIVKSYNELRTELNKKGLVEPAEGAPQAEIDAYLKARGRPDAATDYTFALPADVPKDMPYDAAFADAFRNWAFEQGFTKKQAAAMHDNYVRDAAKKWNTQLETNNAVVTAATTELTKAWGGPETETHKRNVEMATRAMRNLHPKLADELRAKGFLAPDGTVLSAPIAEALAKAGSKMYAEDGIWGGGHGTEIKNPWVKGQENLTMQGEIYKADPDRANQMRKAAGLQPLS